MKCPHFTDDKGSSKGVVGLYQEVGGHKMPCSLPKLPCRKEEHGASEGEVAGFVPGDVDFRGFAEGGEGRAPAFLKIKLTSVNKII